jgi:hypothetical protein
MQYFNKQIICLAIIDEKTFQIINPLQQKIAISQVILLTTMIKTKAIAVVNAIAAS